MLGNLRISFKLLAMVVLVFAAIGAIASVGLVELKANMLEDRKAKLRDVVQLAVQNVTRDYQDAISAGITEQAATSRLKSSLRDLRYGNNDYFFAYDRAGVSQVLLGPKTEGLARWELKDSDGVPFVREMIEGAARGGAFVAYRYPRAGSAEPVPKLAYATMLNVNGWMIGTGVYIDDIDATFRTQVLYLGCFAAVTLLLVTGACLLLGRSITRPVNALTAVMRDLAGGSLDVAILYTRQRDELGEMARAVVVFKDNALAVRRLQTEQEQERQRADAEKRTALTHMADTIEAETGASLEHIHRRTTAMTATADAMTASAGRTGAAAESAANAAGQAMANARSVAGAAEQLAASIREIGGQMSRSAAAVGRAVTAGSETRATIETLNQEVERIGAVADMIGEIAARTNLLALNATIEAARAGDAGKGFAVVASEVKALATQTAHSTREIARHISQVRTATEASVAAVARIEQTITEVNAIAGSIAVAIEQQSAATSEIARNVTETATAANQMTTRITEVSAEAGETGREATNVRENATGLRDAMEALRHSVIHVVRTSTTDVDRRGSMRYAMDISCRLTIAGQNHSARVVDLSSTGAQVRGAPALQTGLHGMLAIDGVDYPLPFIIDRTVDAKLGLEFQLDNPTAAKFAETVQRLGQLRAA